MNAVIEFYTKLVGVHLLFWRLSFKVFDVIPLFVLILGILGFNELAGAQGLIPGLKSVGAYAVVQFIVFVFCFAFCFVWPRFRRRYQVISGNMICFTLSIAFLAAIFALVIKLILAQPPLQSNVADALRGFIYGDLARFAPSVEDSFSIILFAVSYGFILVNTFIVVGGRALGKAIVSFDVVPLIVGAAIALLGTMMVVKPIVFPAS